MLWGRALLPLLLLAFFLITFLRSDSLGLFKGSVPPIEEIFIERVTFSPEQIQLEIFNDGPQEVTIAQVLVNSAYWQFTMEPSPTLKPLQGGKIFLSYPWVEGDPQGITLISSNGVTFDTEVDVAFETPTFNFRFFRTFVLLGLYVGVIPVFLGLLWFPFFRKLRTRGYMFLLSLTIGLLIFLGFDALAESFELTHNLPDAYNGIGVLLIGFLIAILILGAVSHKTLHHSEKRGEHYLALMWAYLIALGIGLHNLGEGLAIGSAYAVGEVALGSTLVIGFMIHNLTEGVAIVAPLIRTFHHIKAILGHIVLMGFLAGAPTILGTIIGGFSYSALFGVFFLAIGSGAIFDVAFDILNYLKKDRWLSIFTFTNVFGFLSGLLIMYFTGFFVLQ